MKIMFTSVGRRVELMQAFKHAALKAEIKLTIYGADISMTAPALMFCDEMIEVPRIRDERYIPTLLEICEREKIDALIPTIDTDLLVLAENKEKFEEIGTKVFISAPDKVAICRDKRFTSDFFISCGLKAPKPVDDYTKYDMGFPAFIKPKDGSSSIDAYKVTDAEDLKAKASMVDDYIIQPFVKGKEYTVDIFCDFEHKPVFITPRERIAVREGEVLKTQICQDEKIKEECKKLIKGFEPVGQITVQLIQDEKTGENYYIEINPRFGGGAPLTIKAGADSAEAAIRIINGEKLDYIDNAADNGLIFSRFDQSVCTTMPKESLNNLKAVILDLDDTIYPERDYVLSGYKEIERELGISSDKLFKAFKEGKPAIDTVLSEEGKLDLKDECLYIYRNHEPKIEAYDGMKDMIKNLRDKGIFVGIITDGRVNGQNAKLNALKLQIDQVIITDELGGPSFRKPCDIAFRIMQKHANCDFAKMVYVGDNPVKDFVAPMQLGMQSICFENEEGLYINNTCSENITKVKSVAELRELLHA